MVTATAHSADTITIGKRPAGDKAVELLGKSLDSLPEHVLALRKFPLGVYRGLSFGLVLHPQFAPEVYLEGKTTRQLRLSRESHGPRAVLNALDRLATAYNSECIRVQQDLGVIENQLRDYKTRFGARFTHDSYLEELTALRDLLKTGLSESASESTDEKLKVFEIAARIKALKDSHTVEATPERTGKRRSSAEEPVTARIRRKALESAGPATLADSDSTEPSHQTESKFPDSSEWRELPGAASVKENQTGSKSEQTGLRR